MRTGCFYGVLWRLICLHVHPSNHLFIRPSSHLTIIFSISPLTYLSVYTCIHPSIHPSVCTFIHLVVCPSTIEIVHPTEHRSIFSFFPCLSKTGPHGIHHTKDSLTFYVSFSFLLLRLLGYDLFRES